MKEEINKFINKNPFIQNEDHPNCKFCNNDRCHTEDYRVIYDRVRDKIVIKYLKDEENKK